MFHLYKSFDPQIGMVDRCAKKTPNDDAIRIERLCSFFVFDRCKFGDHCPRQHPKIITEEMYLVAKQYITQYKNCGKIIAQNNQAVAESEQLREQLTEANNSIAELIADIHQTNDKYVELIDRVQQSDTKIAELIAENKNISNQLTEAKNHIAHCESVLVIEKSIIKRLRTQRNELLAKRQCS